MMTKPTDAMEPFAVNNVYCGDCAKLMAGLADDFIDLTVTSPPYDDMRVYKGFSFDFPEIAKQLYRITKPGGVLVWVVGDQTVNGAETLTAFKQAIAFTELGYRLHDTMLYKKNTSAFPASKSDNRYTQIFEYMFVLSKGKPKTANLLCDKENHCAGVTKKAGTTRLRDGRLVDNDFRISIPARSPRTNVWEYSVGKGCGQKSKIAYGHPATFPEKLAEDHIRTWSNISDLVFDPMAGSGTTLMAARKYGRLFLGFDISPEYVDLMKKHLNLRITSQFF